MVVNILLHVYKVRNAVLKIYLVYILYKYYYWSRGHNFGSHGGTSIVLNKIMKIEMAQLLNCILEWLLLCDVKRITRLQPVEFQSPLFKNNPKKINWHGHNC